LLIIQAVVYRCDDCGRCRSHLVRLRSEFERMWPSVMAWKFLTSAIVFITLEGLILVRLRLKQRRH